MSLFHAAAQPKVRLRKRAEHLIEYLQYKNRFSRDVFGRRDREIADSIETLMLVKGFLETDPSEDSIAFADDAISTAERVYPHALSWRKPIREEGILAAITIAVYSIAIWAYWRADPVTVYAMPVILMPADSLPLNIKNANAA
jgi:hypothetical protein